MFYVKTVINNDCLETALTQEICDGEDGNIFTRCPSCGDEIYVNLNDLILSDGTIDLFSTECFCDECQETGKVQEWIDFMNGKRKTFNGKIRK